MDKIEIRTTRESLREDLKTGLETYPKGTPEHKIIKTNISFLNILDDLEKMIRRIKTAPDIQLGGKSDARVFRLCMANIDTIIEKHLKEEEV